MNAMSSPMPMLALTFGSPWLLGGLALGAIPIVIHLLYRRRYRETSWAAMRFLLEAVRKHSRRIRLEQLLLLVVRTLVILLVVIGLAEPSVESFGRFLPASLPVHRIIVVDVSYSMGYRAEGQTHFERAVERAARIARRAGPGDAQQLVTIRESQPRVIIGRPSYDARQVAREIEQLKLSEEPGELLTTLAAVDELLDTLPEIPRKEVVFVSDFQRSTWNPTSSVRRASLQQALARLAERSRLRLIDVHEGEMANGAVTALAADVPSAVVGQPVRITAEVRYFGPAAELAQNLELSINGRVQYVRPVLLRGSAPIEVEFVHTFDAPGDFRVEARIQSDSLPIDDQRRLVIPVRGELNVALINGKPAGRPEDQASFYAALALAPSTRREPSRGVVRPNVLPDGSLPELNLSRYDVLVLCNVPLLTQREAELLDRFVRSGGGLIIALGDQVDLSNYNRVLDDAGRGLLPAKLGQTRGRPLQGQGFAFDPLDFAHPIVRPFQGNPQAGLETTLTFVYVRVEEDADSDTTTVMRFDTGDPAILEKPHGAGRVVLVTTSLGREWGTWPVWPSFPPLMHEMVRFAASGRWQHINRQVGEPLLWSFPYRVLNAQTRLARPDGTTSEVAVSEDDGLSRLVYADTDQSGFYELRLTGSRDSRQTFAVNVDPQESDLSSLALDVLESELLPTPSAESGGYEGGGAIATGRRALEGAALSRWLLAAAFWLLLTEQVMAWRFRYGLVMLLALVAWALLMQLLPSIAPFAMGFGGLALLTGLALRYGIVRRRTAASTASRLS